MSTQENPPPAPLTLEGFASRWLEQEAFVRGFAKKKLRLFFPTTAQRLVGFATAKRASSLASSEAVYEGVARDLDLVDDVVQQVALEFFEHLLAGKNVVSDRTSDVRRWLCCTTRRVTFRLADRAARFGFSLSASDEEEGVEYDEAVAPSSSPEVLVQVKEVFERLTPEERKVCEAAVEGVSHAEFAEAHGVKEGTSRAQRSRVLCEFFEAAELKWRQAKGGVD